ncbi:unnamed protein product [Camellia sinensis]
MECVQYCWGQSVSYCQKQHSLEKPSACDVGIVVSKKLLVFNVDSFSFFLFSSLVAEGLKLTINLLNRKDADEAFWVNQWSYVVFWKIGCQNPNVCGYEGYQRENETRMSSNHYLVFEYMKHDLFGLAVVHGVKFTEPQV